MGTQILFLIKTCFFAAQMGFVCFSYLITVLGCVLNSVTRLKKWYIALKKKSTSVLIHSQETTQTDKGTIEQVKNGDLGEENDSGSFLRFRFRTYEEFLKNNREIVNVEGVHPMKDEERLSREKSNDVHTALASPVDDFNHVEEIIMPQISSEIVGSVRKTESKSIDITEVSQRYFVNELVGGEKGEEMRVESEELSSQLVHHSKSFDENVDFGNIIESSKEVKFEDVEQQSKFIDDSRQRAYFLSDDDDSLVSDSDSDSMVSSTKSSFKSSFLDSISDGFLSDIDFQRAFEELELKPNKEHFAEEDIELHNLMKGYETDDFEDEDEEILQELKNIEESISESGNVTIEQDYEANEESKQERVQHDEKPNFGEQLSSDSDEQNELETQWEHQDLVEQLKMEIRKVRAIGLPTILEEFESPKIAEDLKPWKIQEKIQREGTLDELFKFYKSYRERMRKLDILNYQKMYAIGVLRLKDPFQSFTRQKISNLVLATFVSLNCWPLKFKSATEVQQQVMKKYSRELDSDLEMVYVGQMCLSWEFLHWEYGKAMELWDSDPHGIRHYNEVAEQFQQFQVLLTRFIEDDSFQGPRVQHYVKSRCVLRNLLQVPLIQEDNLRDKKKGRMMVSSKDSITSVKLVELIEESIRNFWQFVRSDKDTSNSNTLLVKCRRGSSIELQNPGDADLLAQVRSSLLKKEKKLKEMSRSESCILRKFQSHQEDSSGHVYFFSQVDLRLVQRVLNMSKITTDQLVWCSDKLSRIKFSGKKLVVLPSVFLFPCS